MLHVVCLRPGCALPGVRPWLLCVSRTPPWPHLAKYNVARWLITARARTPGRSAMASLRPPDAAMASPIQVQCCTLVVYGPGAHSRAFGHGFFASPGRRHGLTWPSTMLHVGRSQPGKQALPPDSKTKQTPHSWGLFHFGIRQCPTLPGRHQPSTIGAERLNFCVRYGNRWIPFAITTGMP